MVNNLIFIYLFQDLQDFIHQQDTNIPISTTKSNKPSKEKNLNIYMVYHRKYHSYAAGKSHYFISINFVYLTASNLLPTYFILSFKCTDYSIYSKSVIQETFNIIWNHVIFILIKVFNVLMVIYFYFRIIEWISNMIKLFPYRVHLFIVVIKSNVVFQEILNIYGH